MVAASRCYKVAQKNADPAFFIRNIFAESVKGALSVLRQFLTTEGPLKIIKNSFYFSSKALSVLQIFKLLP